MSKEQLSIQTLPGYSPDIGRQIWCLEDVRQTLVSRLHDLSQDELDADDDGLHSIGTLLYHIAAVEAGWLYGEVLCRDWDSEIEALFPDESWDDSKLQPFKGESVEQHIQRLQKVRDTLCFHFKQMNDIDWRTSRELEEYDVTPEWVIYHLIEHEARHSGQIFQKKRIRREHQ
ncbi:DNA damage-inducible protein DinB [Jeotgalibacillus alimentarius]|uniref:DNA damage-inducible protein DinB n=1 Tax=Jeotgalibacillus alimentarius TaxID=135826 RepID=A0A0C2SBX6_9BACL|nr:DinB family protein [Jeotgalibacillus alimentarius]KIL51454.1 DNA damage-inducible protein DinB [Jeotgalibacillus alimentarius]